MAELSVNPAAVASTSHTPAPEPNWLERVRSALWSETVHRFYEASIIAMPSLPISAEIREATDEDEARMAETFPQVPFARRRGEGDRAWLAFVDGRLAHQSWTSTTRAFIPQVGYERRLAPDEVYFYDCVTLAAWRGRGLYPAVLTAVARFHVPEGRSRAVLGILRENDPSHRGAMKAGYSARFDHRFVRRLGLAWSQERPLLP